MCLFETVKYQIIELLSVNLIYSGNKDYFSKKIVFSLFHINLVRITLKKDILAFSTIFFKTGLFSIFPKKMKLKMAVKTANLHISA